MRRHQFRKISYQPQFEGLVDVIDYDGESSFLVDTPSGLEIVPSWFSGGDTHIPPKLKDMRWGIPQGRAVLQYMDSDSDEAVYDDLVEYLRSVSDLPDDRHYNMLAIWVMHTYLMEKMQYSPMVCLFSGPGKGKTRTGKALTFMSYRGLLTPRMDESWIIRIADEIKPTLFFDLYDAWGKTRSRGSEDTILQRFERDTMVPRVINQQKGFFGGTKLYNVFGPTIIATNKEANEALATRSLVIRMQRSNKLFDNCVTPEAIADLKDRLTAFRCRHMASPLPYVVKPINGRLGDIMRPLLQVSELAAPKATPILRALINDIARESAPVHRNTPEAELLLAVDSLRHDVNNGHLPVMQIADVFNSSKPKIEELPYVKIGYMGSREKTE